ncbi:MAG: hypothetical protein ABW133_09120 [Polyangiaceae bacterium]
MATDPASLAVLEQHKSGYLVDTWLNVELEAMTKVWQGIGGHSNFFFSEEDARQANGAYERTQPQRFAESLWRMAQVQPNAVRGFRDSIGEYVVDIRTSVAMGVCAANPGLGIGTVIQYFIPDWEKRLHATGREFKFAQKNYPKL